MEYSKETEKFSYGFGVEKGKLKELVSSEKSEKTQKQEIAELALSAAAVVGITVLRLKFGKNKDKNSKKKSRR